ncbi:MAG: hypothetical protein D6741_06620 [Planctomycetota bacterium]|nr:MAG: hypothetical protein D6741_06620 [Planctomycetota bacterium]
MEYAASIESGDPRCVVSIIGCTGDWTGGWDCSGQGEPDRFITPDLQSGRLVDVIQRGEPAVMVCHWTGIYYNGQERGFQVFQEVVRRLNQRYDDLIWMKLSELARYWAARELTEFKQDERGVRWRAPFACPHFTIRVTGRPARPPVVEQNAERKTLREVRRPRDLQPGTWLEQQDGVVCCFDLSRGSGRLV